MSRAATPIAVVPALLLVGVALWETCATPRYAAGVPSDKTWQKAADYVRANHQPGDLIVFAPEWIDPVGRMHLGDLIPVDMAARMDAARYGRIWEVAIRGERSPETAGIAPTDVTDTGGGRNQITVRHYTRTPVTVVADVREHLATAKLDGPGRPTLELAEVGFTPRRCIQIVPPPKQSVRITFPQLALGTKLVGYVGLADVFTRRSPRGPGTLAVEIGGKQLAIATAGVDDGWVRFEAATTPGTADVTFVASATDPSRLICFAAEARR